MEGITLKDEKVLHGGAMRSYFVGSFNDPRWSFKK